MSNKNILQKGKKATKKVAFVVAIFAVLKGLAGFFSGSIVLLSDGFEDD